MIISVGYRVKSLQGTQFRIWATKVLNNYLVKGYAVNQKRILEQKKIFEEFKNSVDFITSKSKVDQLKSETVTKHDHNPVNDAMGNLEAFERLMKGER